MYGVLERQFRRHFHDATRIPGVTGENLLRILELRLDNVVYRLGYADSRAQARQLIRHGHFKVNGRKLNIPSYRARVGDTVTVRSQSLGMEYFLARARIITGHDAPDWLSVDAPSMTGRVINAPQRDQIDVRITEQLIVEYYSR